MRRRGFYFKFQLQRTNAICDEVKTNCILYKVPTIIYATYNKLITDKNPIASQFPKQTNESTKMFNRLLNFNIGRHFLYNVAFSNYFCSYKYLINYNIKSKFVQQT